MSKRAHRDTKYEELIHKLETKYEQELNMPDWSEWELEEMGDNIARDIREALKVKANVLETINALYKKYHR